MFIIIAQDAKNVKRYSVETGSERFLQDPRVGAGVGGRGRADLVDSDRRVAERLGGSLGGLLSERLGGSLAPARSSAGAAEMPAPTRVCPLYGMLPLEEQRRAIAPSGPGERKIVLATPVAETSLTIEGVRIVVDGGLCRKPVFDPRTALEHLETVRISKDMATQRAGRAGRVAPGVCYRLWSEAAESRMAEIRTPEILEADLAPLVLQIAAFGEPEPGRLPWHLSS